MIKLKKLNCDKTQKLEMGQNSKSNFNKTQNTICDKKSITQIVTKLKLNLTKLQRPNCDINQKLKLVQTLFMTKL